MLSDEAAGFADVKLGRDAACFGKLNLAESPVASVLADVFRDFGIVMEKVEEADVVVEVPVENPLAGGVVG